MKKWLLSGFILTLVVIGFVLFYPREYELPPARPLPTHQFWELSTGSKIAYRYLPAKEDTKPYPIIYLHGGPGGFITDQQVAFFGQLNVLGHSVYLYDQIGSGNSERLENIGEYTATRHLADLEAIIKKIDAEKVILAGQSWGAILATMYAAEHAEKVEKLVLLCPGPLAPFNYKLAQEKAPDSLNLKQPWHTNREANDKMRTWRSTATQYIAIKFLEKLATDEEADAFQAHLNYELQKSTVVDSTKLPPVTYGGGYYVQQMTMASIDYVKNPRKSLPDSTLPTLIIKGQYDNQPWGYTNEYLRLFPSHQFVLIEYAGHATYLDKPEETLLSISGFLE